MKHTHYFLFSFLILSCISNLPMDLASEANEFLATLDEDASKTFNEKPDFQTYAIELDKEKNTPLHLAARSGDVEKVHILVPHSNLEARNSDGRTPLAVCMHEWNRKPQNCHNYKKTASFLIEAGSKPSVSYMLHDCVRYAHPTTTLFLLKNNSQVDIVDHWIKLTPLLLALTDIYKASNSKSERVDRLYDISEMLIAHGAHGMKSDKKGMTPLIWGGIIGNKKLLQQLIGAREVKINQSDTSGDTALMHTIRKACKAGLENKVPYDECIELLILKGANPYIFNRDELNCFHIAQKDNYVEDTLDRIWWNKDLLQSMERQNDIQLRFMEMIMEKMERQNNIQLGLMERMTQIIDINQGLLRNRLDTLELQVTTLSLQLNQNNTPIELEE